GYRRMSRLNLAPHLLADKTLNILFGNLAVFTYYCFDSRSTSIFLFDFCGFSVEEYSPRGT
ncbi:MAG: hypothetical protein ACRD2L_08320, partial [Terriglobia bacterium]